LYELANHASVASFGSILVDGSPYLEVFHPVPVFVLGRSLPSNDISTQGRETELVDVGSGENRNDEPDGSVDDRHPMKLNQTRKM
jgi:hypothetical protein